MSDPVHPAPPADAAISGDGFGGMLGDNRRMLGKLAVVAALMFGFGYALVPMYRAICAALGIKDRKSVV